MLTNLNFIQKGEQWPPKSEKDRIERYRANRKLFNGEHTEVFKEQLKRIERVFGNFNDVIGYSVMFNYHRLISCKTADLLLGEFPEINTKNTTENDTTDEKLTELLDKLNMRNQLYMLALDISSYGEGIAAAGKTEDGKAQINAVQAETWFPVVNPNNIKDVINHVIAWVVKYDTNDIAKEELHIQIHYKGHYEYSVRSIQSGIIGNCIKPSKVFQTGLDSFAVFPLQGLVTTDSIYGHDDYEDINSIVSEIMVRVGQISRILDKHAAPSMYGPESAVEQDEQGQYSVKAGNYFFADGADKPPGYLTWDGRLDSAFEQVKDLLKRLYSLSEMGGALLGDPDHMGGTESARALRLRMINPLAKVQRIATNITPMFKELISAITKLDNETGLKLEPKDITINWFDGLPNDEKEDQEIIQIQNGNKPTMSRVRSIMQANNMNKQQAEDELNTILDEEVGELPTFTRDEITDDSGDADVGAKQTD